MAGKEGGSLGEGERNVNGIEGAGKVEVENLLHKLIMPYKLIIFSLHFQLCTYFTTPDVCLGNVAHNMVSPNQIISLHPGYSKKKIHFLSKILYQDVKLSRITFMMMFCYGSQTPNYVSLLSFKVQ